MSFPGSESKQDCTASETPTVSICIPSFNAEDSIVLCLESVLAQDSSNAEIVLVDNCSTDRTIELATAALQGVPNVRIVQNESNIGRVPNWNRCIELARGEYLKFAFTNDALLPGALVDLVTGIQADPSIVMVGSRQRSVSKMPEVLPKLPKSYPRKTLESDEALEFFARNGFAAAGSLNGMIYRRSVILQHRLWFNTEIPYFSDFIQALEMATYGRTVLLDVESHCFNMGALHRHHNVGMKNPSQYLAEHRVCTGRHMELLRQQGCDENLALNYLLGRYYWYLGEGWKLSARDAMNTFSGFPRHQVTVAAKTLWCKVKQKLKTRY